MVMRPAVCSIIFRIIIVPSSAVASPPDVSTRSQPSETIISSDCRMFTVTSIANKTTRWNFCASIINVVIITTNPEFVTCSCSFAPPYLSDLLRPGRQCCHSAASAFRQPSATCSTSLPSQHLRPPYLFSCRPHSLEFSPGFHPGPDHQCGVFQTFA